MITPRQCVPSYERTRGKKRWRGLAMESNSTRKFKSNRSSCFHRYRLRRIKYRFFFFISEQFHLQTILFCSMFGSTFIPSNYHSIWTSIPLRVARKIQTKRVWIWTTIRIRYREILDPITESGHEFGRAGWLNHDSDSAGWMKNGWAIVSGIIVSGPWSRGAIIVEEFIPVALTDVTNLSVALNPRPNRLMTF